MRVSPLDILLPYQRRFVLDDSRLKIWLASRQIGKSFAVGMEVAMDCLLHPGTAWVLFGANQDQALELLDKVKVSLRAWELALEWEGIETDAGGEHKVAKVRCKNGSTVVALPARPASARGYSGNIVLDEFAFHDDPTAFWRAVFPIISNPLKGLKRCVITSTPNGQGGQGSKFYDIWSGGPDDGWSCHKTTIHDAVADGLASDIEALRKGAGDLDTWRQEFECEFIDGSRVAFPYDLIAACEDPAASLHDPCPPEGVRYVGIDVGTVNDPTVCVTLERRDGRLYVVEMVSLQGAALSDQDAMLAPRIERAARASIDASGIGRDIAQRMVRRFGGKVIEQATTAKWKRQAFQALIAAMSDKRIALPGDRALRDDLHAYQVTGAGETASYTAPRTADGHSDRTSAIVHAWDAATQPTSLFCPMPIPRRPARRSVLV